MRRAFLMEEYSNRILSQETRIECVRLDGKLARSLAHGDIVINNNTSVTKNGLHHHD